MSTPMSIVWSDDLAAVDWDKLSALYRIAPLGNKAPADLALVFGNSLFRAFAYDEDFRREGFELVP